MSSMRVWTNTTFRALDLLAAPVAGGEADVPNVQTIVAMAAEAKVPLVLTRCELPPTKVAGFAGMPVGSPVAAGPKVRSQPIESSIIAADALAITIGRPVYKPGQRSLAPGERLQMRFKTEGGTYVGLTSVIARFEPSDGQVAYRLTLPDSLVFDDRRRSERVSVAFQSPPTVEVLNAPTHRPIASGSLVDLAIGGARVRSVTDAQLRPGDRVLLRATLSDEMRIHSLGIVVHAGRRADGTTDIGVRFTAEVPHLDRYLRDVVS
jgi:c-di-GMP-binding flagellar brake protein YcgR